MQSIMLIIKAAMILKRDRLFTIVDIIYVTSYGNLHAAEGMLV